MSKSSFILERANQRPILIDYSCPEGDSKGVILFAHGFKGYKDWGEWNLVQKYFVNEGFTFVKFNFSCNGGTMDNPIDFPDLDAFSENSYWQEQLDIQDVVKWSFDKFKENIHLIGHSRGGGAVLLQSINPKVKTVTSWAGVSDFMSRLKESEVSLWKKGKDVIVQNARTKQDMPMGKKFYEDLMNHQCQLNIRKAVEQSKVPILAIHAKDDQAVSYNDSENLSSWSKNVQVVIYDRGGHTFGTKHPGVSDMNPTLENLLRDTLSFLLTK